MTQWLVEEAAFAALELWEAQPPEGQPDAAEQLLLDRHAEMVALREAQRGVR